MSTKNAVSRAIARLLVFNGFVDAMTGFEIRRLCDEAADQIMVASGDEAARVCNQHSNNGQCDMCAGPPVARSVVITGASAANFATGGEFSRVCGRCNHVDWSKDPGVWPPHQCPNARSL